MDPELEELPTDLMRGLDFRISKTSKGGFADYNSSKWKHNYRGGNLESKLRSLVVKMIKPFFLKNMNNIDIKSSWMVIENDDVSVSTITHLAKLSGLVKSYSEAKSLIKSGGLYLNNQKITDVNREISTDDLLYNKYILLRKGKSNYFIFKLNHDETSMANTTR